MSAEGRVFELGSLRLQSGIVLANARLVYQTYGTLSPDRSNVVLYPTSFGAQHTDIEWLIAPSGILDPSRYFVIIVNMFGGGLSTSPSHTGGEPFAVSHYDNVAAQDRLLSEVFNVERLALVYGWSMGAQQAYHWAVLHPERVARIAALCGTARTSEHNLIFLKSLEAALQGRPSLGRHSLQRRARTGRAGICPHLRQLGCIPSILPRAPVPPTWATRISKTISHAPGSRAIGAATRATS